MLAGIGIIFGANIGTTTGAWLVAGFGLKVNISAYAMPLLAIGVVLVFQKSKYLRGSGYVLAGLGFLFLGIHHMKVGFETFKDAFDLTRFAMTGVAGTAGLHAGRHTRDGRHAIQPCHDGSDHHRAGRGADQL